MGRASSDTRSERRPSRDCGRSGRREAASGRPLNGCRVRAAAEQRPSGGRGAASARRWSHGRAEVLAAGAGVEEKAGEVRFPAATSVHPHSPIMLQSISGELPAFIAGRREITAQDGSGVAPLSWTPDHRAEEVFRWQKDVPLRAGVPAPDGVRVALVRAGRTPGELAREFECSAQAVRNWVRQAERDAGHREDGLTSAEREELRRLRRENRQLREEREILKKAAARVRSGDRDGAREVFELVRANRAEHNRATMCRVLGVSPSGYHAWVRRGRSRHARRDEELRGEVRAIHVRSRGTYGAPRVPAELAAQGHAVSRKRVARLMREQGLAGVSRRLGAAAVRRRDPGRRPAHPQPRRPGQAHRARTAQESIPAHRRRVAPSQPRYPDRRTRDPLPQHLSGSRRPLGTSPVCAHRADTHSTTRRTTHRNVPSTGNSRKLKKSTLINQLKFVTSGELRLKYLPMTAP